MVTIPQHRTDGGLNDLSGFLGDIEGRLSIGDWTVNVRECLGEAASQVEALGQSDNLTPERLRDLYSSIYQTIDGEFVGRFKGHVVCRLIVVDSSFWHIEATPEFEAYMLQKYGAYSSDA